jgi:hypothetical protein
MTPDRHCLSDGELRALLDDVRPSDPHLARCPDCRTRLERLRADAGVSAAILATAAPSEVDVNRAYLRWQRRLQSRNLAAVPAVKGDLMHGFTRAQRGAVAGAVLALVMTLSVAFTPVTTLADTFLNQFRIQHFAAITIPMDLVQNMSQAAQAQAMDPGNVAALQNELKQLGSFSTTVDQNSATKVDSISNAAQQFSGLDVPSDLSTFSNAGQPTNIYLGKSGSATYQMNVAEVQKLMSSLGLSTQGLPDAQTNPTVTFKLDINPAAVMEWEQNGKHLVVGQTRSPVLNVPSSVNMDELRNDLLDFPLIPADIKAQLRAVNDWSSTLIVPIPQGASQQQVTIHNAQGLLVKNDQMSFVLWQDNGVLHVVGTDGDANVMTVANSLKAAS